MHYLFRGITLIGEERESNRSGSDSVPIAQTECLPLEHNHPALTNQDIGYLLSLDTTTGSSYQDPPSSLQGYKGIQCTTFPVTCKRQGKCRTSSLQGYKGIQCTTFPVTCKRQGKCRTSSLQGYKGIQYTTFPVMQKARKMSHSSHTKMVEKNLWEKNLWGSGQRLFPDG